MKIEGNIIADFIYSESIYRGVMEGVPDEKTHRFILEHLIKKAKTLRDDLEPHVIGELDAKTLSLGRGNIAYISDDVKEKHSVIIWFDKGDKDARETLREKLSQYDWLKYAKTFVW